MKLFISWSGPTSHSLALALRDWLPSVLPHVHPWVSSEDIAKGKRWSAELGQRLQETAYCIVCVTPGTARQPWVNFEAGAIAKVVEEGQVSPLLLGVNQQELRDLPLSMFQCTEFTKDDVARLLGSINAATNSPIASEQLRKNLNLCWPGLVSEVERIDVSVLEGVPQDEDDADDDDDSADFLDELEEKLLLAVEAVDGQRPTADYLAVTINENLTRTKYHLARLVEWGYLFDLHSTRSPTSYGITEKGRAYLVENELD